MHIPRWLTERLRHDGLLIGGLGLALLVLFLEPLQRLFAVVGDIERQTGAALFPALVVLLAALMLHQQRKRYLATLEGRAVAANLEAADERARDLERLVAFGHATADALDFHALREATRAHIVNVSGGRDAWVVLRTGSGGWQELAQASATGRTFAFDELAAAASGALAQAAPDHAAADGQVPLQQGEHACFPLSVGGMAVGVFGVWTGRRPLSSDDRHRQAAAAALLAIGVKNIDMVREIREHSLRDALTGCCNRAHAVESLHVELRRAQRAGRDVSVIMLDLDHFKHINDGHGHLTGDAVLAHVGHLLRTTLRAADLKARYGGEEFLVILPETPLAAARGVADALRRTLAQSAVPVGNHTMNVTASLGLTCAAPGELDETAVIARADAALYDAKRAGRDCVRVVEPPRDAGASPRGVGAERRAQTPRPSHDGHLEAGVR